MNIVRIFLSFLFLFFNCLGFAQSRVPQLFLFLGGDKASSFQKTLQNPCIQGVQIIYSWRQLEPQKGVYDFSKIEEDWNFLSRIDKKLFIQIQDRSFSPDVFHVPDYIRLEKAYHGGVVQQYDFPGEGKPITTGWVARTWDPAVRKRFQLLLKKLASKFDGKIYGINLPETSIDLDPDNLPEDFSSDKYFYSVLDNIGYLKKAFQKSRVIQYVNFFPDEWNNDHHYMSRLFAFARKHHIGLGGPDVVPYKKSQMKNSYPFFHKFKGKIETAIAIQEPDYTYTNPKTGDFYRFDDFYSFSQEYLGAFILFWNMEEPFFSEQLLPKLNRTYFNCEKVNNEANTADAT
ncbi:TPA: hypothetical protein RG395_002785 [Legionella pneumophila]|nr:hypothetical protein [Legionella pneumophila]MDW8880326.1 hypothetical protein [Legionella pneumophila subsp. fraseri]MDW8963280.1 hypothetical protein [Legionella pneumophila subsp. fraseri]MDW9036940.1 hypothetical protein [Legionella pneumophila subsp. fraseri]MDW9040127.1 hypothetical protein [Legionella pneumophila subsp. fraseri]MDW9043134.1 hypothetical protein [Legionella pneumophila subsp. fraseri]